MAGERSRPLHGASTSGSHLLIRTSRDSRPNEPVKGASMSRTRRFGACVATAAMAGAIAVPGTAAAKPVITMSGSTSVAPLATQLIKAYVKQFPGRVKFRLAQGGSDIGVADVAAGRVTIGNSSRDPKPTDPGGIFFNKIAKDAICVVTNPANKSTNFDQNTIQSIFSGKVRDWSEVPGASA